MPWAPAPQASNPFAWARILAARGLNEREIANALRMTYNTPGAPRPAIREAEVTRAARLAFSNNERMQNLLATEGDAMNAPRSWSFFNPAIPSTYRYHVLFDLGPDDDGVVQYRTVIVDSTKRLTLAQLGMKARGVFDTIAEHYGKFAANPVDADTPFELQLYERRTR